MGRYSLPAAATFINDFIVCASAPPSWPSIPLPDFDSYVGTCASVTYTAILGSIDRHVVGQGRIEVAGEFSPRQSNSIFRDTGGSNGFAQARGCLATHQETAGTRADQRLYLYLR